MYISVYASVSDLALASVLTVAVAAVEDSVFTFTSVLAFATTLD